MLIVASPASAQAQPATVTGCAFDAAALAAALEVEQQGAAQLIPPITVACAGDSATVTLHHPDRAPTVRVVDLIDVPAPLAPRVVALMAVAAAQEPTAIAPPATGEPRISPSTTTSTTTAASTPAGLGSAAGPTAIDRVAPAPTAPARPSLLDGGLGARPIGVAARGLARIHDGTTTLWGASAAVTAGPGWLGITAAGTRLDHTLGTLTPWIVAADAGVTVACAGALCAALRGELGRVTVAADAIDSMSITSRSLSATYLHGAAEVSLSTRIAGLDLAATAAVGTSRGVIARADQDAAAVVAGWTFTGAVEVRR